MPDPTTTFIQSLLDRLRGGDQQARADLLRHTAGRLRHLTQEMFRDYPRVRRFEETDDVFNTALMRLHRSLADVSPGSPAEYYRLAAVQVRRVLIDLARHYFGPEGDGRNLAPTGEARPGDSDVAHPAHEGATTTYEPGQLASWSEFHQVVEGLPDEARAVFDLHFYQGLTLDGAAEALGVSLATVKRRWTAARLLLAEKLGGHDFGQGA